MALGRHMLETGSLIIDHSIFTWTPAISYYAYNSWLADIILYLTYNHAGAPGLIALRFGVYFLLLFLAWRYASIRGIAKNPITWVVVLVALTMVWPAHLIKPELFTIGFFSVVVWLYFHIRHRGESSWWRPYLFPLILVIWVNTHGAFFIVSLFFAATVIGEITNSLFSPSQAMPARLRKHFFFALALCFPAIFVSPFGYELPFTIIREVLANDDTNKYIVSYKPTSEFNNPPLYMLDYLLIAMLLFVLLLWQKLKNRQTDWVVILAFLGYCAIYTQVVRVSFFLGPVFLFTCLDLLAEKRHSWAWSYSKINRALVITLCMSITTIIIWRTSNDNSCKLACPIDSIQQAFHVSTAFPVAETEYIKKNLPGTKVGNMYQAGGYLLYHLWPEKQIMIDPRYFPFREWIDDYFAFTKASNMKQFIQKNTADYWFITYNNPSTFLWFYQSSDWKLALLGSVGAIFIPSDGFGEKPIMLPEAGTRIGSKEINTAFIAAIQMDDLTFAKQLVNVAQGNLECPCNIHRSLMYEMKDTLTGFQAYNSGKYQEAASILGKKSWNHLAQNKAINALMILAEHSWNQADIAKARSWYQQAFKIQSPKTIIDIYNFTLLEWHYYHLNETEIKNSNTDLDWQKLADFIIANEAKIPPSQHHIIETVKAMKEGHYDGTAQFVLQNGSFSPLPSKQKKNLNRDK